MTLRKGQGFWTIFSYDELKTIRKQKGNQSGRVFYIILIGLAIKRRPIPLLRRDRAVLKPNVSEGTKAYICERVNNRSRSGTFGLEDRYAANYTMLTYDASGHRELNPYLTD